MSAVSCASIQSGIRLLVVGPDDRDHVALRRILEPEYELHRAAGRQDAVALVQRFRPKVVICEQDFADGNWRRLLADMQAVQAPPFLIVYSRLADEQLWSEVLNLGGYDVLIKPFADREVNRVVKMATFREPAKSAGGRRVRTVAVDAHAEELVMIEKAR